ncbi:hypothetical protein [Arcticibacter sp.]|uniref:hypothetical protein n=1 Tax=Arcticibacter sp. TaxID=1872630 RepID=UPI00388DB9EC
MQHQQFTITHQGNEIFVTALFHEEGNDLVYDCYSGDVLLGTLYPEISEDYPAVDWKSEDMSADLVQLIGDAIEKQDL